VIQNANNNHSIGDYILKRDVFIPFLNKRVFFLGMPTNIKVEMSLLKPFFEVVTNHKKANKFAINSHIVEFLNPIS